MFAGPSLIRGRAVHNASDRNIVLRIRRQDGPGRRARWEEFAVPSHPNANIISCLQYIAAHPVTTDGTATTPPVWDSVCLEEMCGACTMLINGRPLQACSALVDRIGAPGIPITVEPLTKFPVVRDLIVDRQRMFNDLKRIKAWVPIGRMDDPQPVPPISPAIQEKRYILSRCMSCGACLEVCPQYTSTNNFVGGAILTQALLFNGHSRGAKLKSDRLDTLRREGGVGGCDSSGKCTTACPKDIPIGDCIDAIGKQVVEHAKKQLKSRSGGRSRTGARRGSTRR